MTRPTCLLILLIALATACAAPAEESRKDEPKPQRPGVTRVEPGTDIKEIPSDAFKMIAASVEGDVLRVKVSYSGGQADHQFTLYWDGIVARSYPGRTSVWLKHDANGDAAEALIEQTVEFDLTTIGKPMHIMIRTDHGDTASVMYGKSNLDQAQSEKPQ